MRFPDLLLRFGLAAGLAGVAMPLAAADGDAVKVSPDIPDGTWVLTPSPNRVDGFYDEEVLLKLLLEQRNHINIPQHDATAAPATSGDPLTDLKLVVEHIENLIAARQWQEAERTTEEGIRKYQLQSSIPAINRYLQVLNGYLEQITEARLREEAEAAFDALDLKVEGILWAETGPRLALINGESKPLGINDRVKDCVIINIDTDRVDFRFHFKRKRFEFPRYVGEDTRK